MMEMTLKKNAKDPIQKNNRLLKQFVERSRYRGEMPLSSQLK